MLSNFIEIFLLLSPVFFLIILGNILRRIRVPDISFWDLSDGPDIKEVIEALRDRSKSLVDMAKNCVMFYHDFEDFDSDLAIKFFNLESRSVLGDLLINLETLDQWSAENIHEVIQSICESRNIGFGKVGQPLRLAISGDGKAGSIDKSAQLVGKKRVLLRLKMAIDWIDSLPL